MNPRSPSSGDIIMIKNWRSAAKIILLAYIATVASLASATDGVTDTTILIGQTVGLTGTVAGPVKETNEGANAYFSSVNQNGGINGRKIEMRTLDDKFD